MRLWLVLDMDDGVLGAYPTRKAAVEEHGWGPVIERHTYLPGAYGYVTGYGDDTTDFFVEREDVARRSGGWQEVVAAWVEAGRPTGRFDTPIGERSEL